MSEPYWSIETFPYPRLERIVGPHYVGGWRIGNTTFQQTRKPRWLTRVLCRWLLEWEWVDA